MSRNLHPDSASHPTGPEEPERPSLSGESVVVAARNVLTGDLGGEVVLMDPNRSTYFGLNGVGTRVWKLIAKPISVRDIREQLVLEYDVAPELCLKEVIGLLDRMLEVGLVVFPASDHV